jgi:feruloyl esterase
VFSAKFHVAWYQRLIAHNDGLRETQKFARMFLVPGMNHCGGGPATSQFDAFAAVVDWVENGKAPAQIVGTAPAGTPWPGRTRPLCAYPKQARYVGPGSIEDAANFRCERPTH